MENTTTYPTDSTPTKAALDAAIVAFVAAAQEVIDAHCKASGYDVHFMPDLLRIRPNGKRFVAIDRHQRNLDGTLRGQGGSVHAFIDTVGGVFQKTTTNKPGDILKPASWKAPAKHPRGSVFDADHGKSSVGPYGVNYLR